MGKEKSGVRVPGHAWAGRVSVSIGEFKVDWYVLCDCGKRRFVETRDDGKMTPEKLSYQVHREHLREVRAREL